MGEQINCQLTTDEQINISKHKMMRKWSYLWQEYTFTNPTRYTRIETKLRKKPWYNKFDYNRKSITTISRMKFGHACYPAHLHKIKILESDLCEFCNKIGDLDHIFYDCQKYRAQSNELFRKLLKLNIESPYNIMHLLALNRKEIYDCLLYFVRITKIQI
uniref:Uncharacterized protein LOC114333648 isoform X1 n=1 Tax=Diabrotica virgifera virgifera TaxID=50390 RepID=A0A6P7FX52_DIAVI